jgi:hypothetical protein
MEQQKKQDVVNHSLESEFIPYKEALALKELGFDNVPCMGVYYNVTNIEDIDIDCEEHFSPCNYETQYYANKGYKNAVLAPLYQQAFRWFREKCGLDGETTRYNLSHSESKILKIDRLKAKHIYLIVIDGVAIDFENVELKDITYYFSKEKAELACLRKLIEIVKNKENENNN